MRLWCVVVVSGEECLRFFDDARRQVGMAATTWGRYTGDDLRLCRQTLSRLSVEDALPDGLFTPIEFADSECSRPTHMSVVSTHAMKDVGLSLAGLVADYPCVDLRLQPSTVHRWRWQIDDNGFQGGEPGEDLDDELRMELTTNAIGHVAFGFGAGADMLLVRTNNDVTFVEDRQGKKLVENKLEYVSYKLEEGYAEPHWLDFEITTGDRHAVRVDVWIREHYRGHLTLNATKGFTTYHPVTLPNHFPEQISDFTVVFVGFEPTTNAALTDEAVLH